MEINKKEIDALYQLNDNFKSKSRILKYISLVLLSLMFGLMPLAVFMNRKLESKQEQEFEAEFIKYIDTLQTKELVINEFDLVKDRVIKLFTSFNENNLIKSTKFYADTLERFYLKENIPISEVEKEIRYHSKKFPDSSLDFNSENIFISKRKDEYLSYIEGDYRKDEYSNPVKILYEIKLNKNFKITYIRNYLSKRKNNIKIDSLNDLFQIVNPHEEIILKIDSSGLNMD